MLRLLLLASLGAAVQSAQVITTTKLTLSSATNSWGSPTTPVYAGINAGHRNDNDTTWIAFLEASGVNGLRIFGGAGLGNLAAPNVPLVGGLVQVANAFGGCTQGPNQGGASLCPTPASPGCVAVCNPLQLLGSSAGSWTPDSFGGSNTYAGSQSYVTAGPYWGYDLTKTYKVVNVTTYQTAVAALRTPAGHNPFQSATSGPGFLAYPPPHDLIDFNNRQMITGDYNYQISGATATVINTTSITLGFRPLVVDHLGCGSFSFSTLDPGNATYWTEHWELYKFSYAAAMWMWKYNITKAEVHNEPDLSSNNACMDPTDPSTFPASWNTAYSSANNVTASYYATQYWADYFSVRSVAHQDAYADANSDVANGLRSCPFPNVCPITLNIYGSAMAQSIGNPAGSSGGIQLGGAMLQNVYFRFPCSGPTCALSGKWYPNSTAPGAGTVGVYPWGTDTTFSNFQIYSYHSYGNNGENLFSKAINYMFSSIPTATPIGTVSQFYGSNVFNWRGSGSSSLSAVSPVSTLPIAVTEFASLTGADFGQQGDSSDSYYHGSRLGTQLINFALLGQETFYFKFSMGPSGSSATQAKTMVSKHGIHFSENNNANSFQIGDMTTSGKIFSMTTPYITGAKQLLSCSIADSVAGWTWPTSNLNVPNNRPGVACAVVKDGNVARIFLVNDCNGTPARNNAGNAIGAATYFCADRLINIPVASLSPAASSVVSISEVSAPSAFCVNQSNSKDQLQGGSRRCSDFGGVFQSFTSSSSASGFFGEVSKFVNVSSIPSTGLPYLLPVFGFARIDIPLAAQTMTAIPSGSDTTLFAGVNANTAYGNYPFLTVGTSSTEVHDSTAVSLLQFPTPSLGASNLALLELTLADAPGNVASPNTSVILQIIGINPKQPVVWNEAAMTWANTQWLLNKPVGLVNSIGTNYVLLGPQNKTSPLSGIYNFVIGHMSIHTSDPVGMVKRVDISRFVKRAQAANACSINIAIVRRFRRNLQAPASVSGETMAADSFTGGSVSFFSGESTTGAGPVLRTYSDSTTSPIVCNPQAQQNFTVSSILGISNVNAQTFHGTLSTIGRRLSAHVPSAANSTSSSVSKLLGVPANAVTVSPTGTFVTNVALTVGANSPPSPSTIQAAVDAAAASQNYSSLANQSTVSLSSGQNISVIQYINGTAVVIPNSQGTTSSEFYNISTEDTTYHEKMMNGARRLLFSGGGVRTGRKLLQQSYSVQVSFTSLQDAEAFKLSFTPNSAVVTNIATHLHNAANGDPDLDVGTIATSNDPSVDTLAVIDVYAPYHSSASSDIVYNTLAVNSTGMNQQFDDTFHGDASNLVVYPSTVQINAGWQPQGNSAPVEPPELLIIAPNGSVVVVAVYLSSSVTLSGYTVATFGVNEGNSFCAAVVSATGAIGCLVTSVTAPSGRHLLTGSVVVAYTISAAPAAAAAASVAMSSSTGALASPATFTATGLTAVTACVPSRIAPTVASGSITGGSTTIITGPSSKYYNRNAFIGLGVGLGVGEFVFFTFFAGIVYVWYVKPLEVAAASLRGAAVAADVK